VQFDLELDFSRDDLAAKEGPEVLLQLRRVHSLDLTVGCLAHWRNGIDVALCALDCHDVHSHSLLFSVYT